MRVILLSGPSNCGKTTSLNLLFNRIKETSGVEVLEPKTWLNERKNDFRGILSCPDGKKLAIITQGDYGNELETYRDYFKDCDILVCACNKKFMHSGKGKPKPFDIVTDYDPMTTIVLKKEHVSKDAHDKANEACAEHLLELIEIIRKQIK